MFNIYALFDRGTLCNGGRLLYEELPKEIKLQTLFPQDSHLARLVVLNSHLLTLHGESSQTFAHIRTLF